MRMPLRLNLAPKQTCANSYACISECIVFQLRFMSTTVQPSPGPNPGHIVSTMTAITGVKVSRRGTTNGGLVTGAFVSNYYSLWPYRGYRGGD